MQLALMSTPTRDPNVGDDRGADGTDGRLQTIQFRLNLSTAALASHPRLVKFLRHLAPAMEGFRRGIHNEPERQAFVQELKQQKNMIIYCYIVFRPIELL